MGVIGGPLRKIFGKKKFRNFLKFSRKFFALACLPQLARAEFFLANFEKFRKKLLPKIFHRGPPMTPTKFQVIIFTNMENTHTPPKSGSYRWRSPYPLCLFGFIYFCVNPFHVYTLPKREIVALLSDPFWITSRREKG